MNLLQMKLLHYIHRTYINSSARIYPNPVAGLTTIELNTIETSDITIRIFDILGIERKKVNTRLVNGNNRIEMNVKNIQEGIYFITFEGTDLGPLVLNVQK